MPEAVKRGGQGCWRGLIVLRGVSDRSEDTWEETTLEEGVVSVAGGIPLRNTEASAANGVGAEVTGQEGC